MELNLHSHIRSFVKTLRSFQDGSVTYQELLSQVDQELADGSSPATLLEILRRGEIIEPLPEAVHLAIVNRIEAGSRLFAVVEAEGEAHPADPEAHPEHAEAHSGEAEAPPPASPIGAAEGEPAGATELPIAHAPVDPGTPLPADPYEGLNETSLAPEYPTIVLGEVEDSTGGADGADRADTTPVTLPSAGDVLGGRFQLLELIGEGGMSRVYKAIDLKAPASGADTALAVKVLTRSFTEHGESYAALLHEVETLQELVHPNIGRLLGCHRDGDLVFMTMEYFEGRSLYAALHAGQSAEDGTAPALPARQVRDIVCAVGAALEYAHGRHVVHGDLKPGNVILGADGTVKVIDFGLVNGTARSKTALERREAAGAKQVAAVTPRYASPQLMARQKPDVTDDVYALACLAYEMLSGSHPFDDGTGAQTLRFPPPRRAGICAQQYSALLGALQFERRNRTATVHAFIEQFMASIRRGTWLLRIAGITAAAAVAVLAWVQLNPTAPAITSPLATAPVPVPATPPHTEPAAASPPAAAATRPGATLRDCPTCPPLTVLPPGRFEQGSKPDDLDAAAFSQPSHAVHIDYPLAMSTNQVTVRDFREFITASGRAMQGCDTYDGRWRAHSRASWTSPGFEQDDDHPVTCTSWNDAVAYAHWLSAKTGQHYRLPSASEWEYAARAGTAAATPWGASGAAACQSANVADTSAADRYPGWTVFACSDGFVHTSPVGSFKANAFGLHDMLGNVFVWTQDCWHEDYKGAPEDGSARRDGDCRDHELRGGSWFSSPNYVSAAYRNHFASDYRTSSVGLRLVREIAP